MDNADVWNGFDANGNAVNHEDPNNADIFWWWPSTTVMDGSRLDALKFFGFPLTCGSEGLPLMMLAFGGGYKIFGGFEFAAFLARQALSPNLFMEGRLFWDNFLPIINYIFKVDKYGDLELFVANAFTGLMGLFSDADFSQDGAGNNLRGAMKIESFNLPVSYWGVGLASAPAGTFGMKFLLANPLLGFMAIASPIIGGAFGYLAEMIGFADRLIALADAGSRLYKISRGLDPDDPLVLDLDGDGIETIAMDSSGVRFDHNDNWFAEETGWLKGDDGFLVLDENGNGRIDDGRELFGGFGQTGTQELATHDSNQDGVITVEDAVWGDLRVWQDKDEDGVVDAGELQSLDDLGIVELSLATTPVNTTNPQRTTFLDKGAFTWANGLSGLMCNAVFQSSTVDTRYAGEAGRAAWAQADTRELTPVKTVVAAYGLRNAGQMKQPRMHQ